MYQTACLYGIKNCDTVKQARNWLDDNGISHLFHDFRANGLNREKVGEWLSKVSGENLLNKRGTTWRKLDADSRKRAEGANLVDLLVENPTLIKRPVLEHKDQIMVGFTPQLYAALFQK